MAVKALDPKAYGFPTRCYVCELDNPSGLRIPFTYDDETRIVHAQFTLGAEYSGAPQYVHGGIVGAVLDEAMAWAAIASAGRFAVMREATTTFEHGVLVGVLHRVEAEVNTAGTIRMEASARVVNEDGKRCARARARMVILSEDAAKQAIGTVEGASTKFLRRRRS
ncbi:MAG: PaaI family thioesterase [Acidimicrobiales bacterium]